MKCCKYCENDEVMMKKDVIDPANWGWGYDDMVKLTLREAEKDPNKLGVFIDRGHLRLVFLHDCNCMDHGQKIKINYCPMCGRKMNANTEVHFSADETETTNRGENDVRQRDS